MLNMVDIIAHKRDGNELTEKEIQYFVTEYTKGLIPDYQASALLMAISCQGMSTEETVILTNAMARSGDMMDLSCYGNLSVDKHSTGGVGDKTTLIVAPIVASLGGKVTKMSGRGLGHTGGTIDKLESIPGFSASMSIDDFLHQVDNVGVAVIGQTGNLAPADKKLYALRDVTATVNSIPLITASIMSKKIAAGAQTIVLDVKVGSGAFMNTLDDARELAYAMVNIGKACGRQMAAVITSMESPLGSSVGNMLELHEALAVLRGEKHGDIRCICVELASIMVSLLYGIEVDEARERVNETIDSGAALQKFKQWIEAQGGDVSFIDHPDTLLCAPFTADVVAQTDGFLTHIDAKQVGRVAMMLGAGRQRKEDTIDHRIGVVIHKSCGDKVRKGDLLCTLYAADRTLFSVAQTDIASSIIIQDDKPREIPLIYDVIY